MKLPFSSPNMLLAATAMSGFFWTPTLAGGGFGPDCGANWEQHKNKVDSSATPTGLSGCQQQILGLEEGNGFLIGGTGSASILGVDVDSAISAPSCTDGDDCMK